MNKTKKNIIIFLYAVATISVIITILGTVIFIFDINGAKGLLPLIFLCIFLYFINLFLVDAINRSANRKLRMDIAKLIFSIIVLIVFILSLFVFWI